MSMMAVGFMVAVGMSTATAVTTDDVNTEVITPEVDSEQKISSFLQGDELSWTVEVSNNMATNDTTVDVYADIGYDTDYHVDTWVNGTDLDAGETKQVSGVLDTSDVPTGDLAFGGQVAYKSDADDTVALDMFSVDFVGVEGMTWSDFMDLITVLILLSVIGIITSRLS